MAHEDDTVYKQLFAHPEMMRDLLLGFVPGEWVRQLDFDTLERVNASYVSSGGRQRHGDMVWKVRLAGEWVYIYLLLEFQSRSDPWMALRMQVYIDQTRLSETDLALGTNFAAIAFRVDRLKEKSDIAEEMKKWSDSIEAVRRIVYAELDELDRWTDRLLDARNIADIFSDLRLG